MPGGGGTPAASLIAPAAAALIALEAGRWRRRNRKGVGYAALLEAGRGETLRNARFPARFRRCWPPPPSAGKSSSENKDALKAISAASIAIRSPAPPPRSWPLLLIALDA